MTKIRVAMCALLSLAACGTVEQIFAAKSGDYHEVSPAKGGVHITIKRHATNAMTAFFWLCKDEGKSDSICGRDVLRVARGQLEKQLHGTALELWNGKYSIFGWHPHIGKGFRDEEGGDIATEIRELKTNGHECLRLTWKPSGTNWTTENDEGVSECGWGKKLG